MASELLSPSELLGKSWDVFARRWKTLVLINLVPVAVGIGIFLLVILGLLATGLAAGLRSGDTAGLMTGGVVVLLLVFFVLYIGAILITLWAQLASLVAISRHEENLTVSQSFALAKGKIWPYFSTAFVVGLLIFAGYMLFIVPGVILAIWFSFAGFVVLNENKKGLEAALTSRGYLRGRFLEVFGRFALIGVIYLGVYILSMGLQAALGDSKELALISVILTIITNLVMFVLNLVAIIFAYLLYEDVKRSYGKAVTIADSTKKKYTIFGIVGVLVGALMMILLMGMMMAILASAVMQSQEAPQSDGKRDKMMELLEGVQSPDEGKSLYGDSIYDYPAAASASPSTESGY